MGVCASSTSHIEDTKIWINPLTWFYSDPTDKKSFMLKMCFAEMSLSEVGKKWNEEGYVSRYHKGVLKYHDFF